MNNAVFWFRRDLRLEDNRGLYEACSNYDRVACLFIFDKNILEKLPNEDRRVNFIVNVIKNLKTQLRDLGSDLIIEFGYPEEIIPKISKKYSADILANEDYEPSARKRDYDIAEMLKKINKTLILFKDQAVFHKYDILNAGSKPFKVFSQYANQWKNKLTEKDYFNYDSSELWSTKLAKFNNKKNIELEQLGFKKTDLENFKIGFSHEEAKKILGHFVKNKIDKYQEIRDYPILNGGSFLSVHNRFGTISIREILRTIKRRKETEGLSSWLSEIIWRDFYFNILYHFPKVEKSPFKEDCENIQWENNMVLFQKWCLGETGYPIIDAAMKQLNSTGYMHNRLRMVVASFLVKDLLVDYRLGEEYFALKLLDYDLSANNGGWQWAASTGCDAQPFFRIFNPITQSKKFDEDGLFIKKWLPIFKLIDSKYIHEPHLYENELKKLGINLGEHYPYPIVNHKERRELALKLFNQT